VPGTTDYYELLGVRRGCSADEIKKAFRTRARETHPDVADHDGAEESFKELNEAYEVLSDPQKREMYDRFGTVDPRMAGGGYDVGDVFGGGGLDDLFSVFFGGVAGGARTMSRDGRDMGAQVGVTLLEAADGVEKEVRYTRDAPCASCAGSGAAAGGSVATCPDCGGAGQRRAARRTFLGTFESLTPCARCGQTGQIVEPPCPVCQGGGRERLTDAVTVDVPAGVVDGMSVRVPGAGEAGFRGARPGDLLVTVRIEPHEFLHREGDDLHARTSVSVAQAALGASITVRGLRGDVAVKIPAGAQFGDTVAVRGEGMPRLRGGGAGDLVVHLAVAVPRKLTKRQKELLRELGETFGDGHAATPLERLRYWLGA
jgi:molecular chaperone DnaJ